MEEKMEFGEAASEMEFDFLIDEIPVNSRVPVVRRLGL